MLHKIVLLIFFLFNEYSGLLINKKYFINSDKTADIKDDYASTINKTVGRFKNYGVAPDWYDWRKQNMVSPVKDQGACGACWAFSAVANIESQLMISQNVQVTLSEQFLIDCDHDNAGCSCGSLLNTYSDIVNKLGGVLRTEDYRSYQQRQMKCLWNGPPPAPVGVSGYARVPPNEDAMVDALYHHGPLSSAINSKSMDNYKLINGSAYIDEPTDEECSPSILNHAVLIVGYSAYKDPTTGLLLPYWIIKNSWGQSCGDQGYYYLLRGRNACGIATDVSYAIL